LAEDVWAGKGEARRGGPAVVGANGFGVGVVGREKVLRTGGADIAPSSKVYAILLYDMIIEHIGWTGEC
jgi:hypothetical protein